MLLNRLKLFVRKNAPDFLIQLLIKGKNKQKELEKEEKRKRIEEKKNSNNAITKEQVIADLVKLGLKKGDSVLVHSSLSKMGYVEGGPVTVIDAITETIGPEGTLMFPTFPFDTLLEVFFEHYNTFDRSNTPSKMGKITEVFRKMDGVTRSFHPTHPVAAKGPLAEYYTKDHYNQPTPFNKNSPFYKLTEKNGKVLTIGLYIETYTSFHVLEDYIEDFKYPVYRKEWYEVNMIDYDGTTSKVKTRIHDGAYSMRRKYNEMVPMFVKDGAMVLGNIGEAHGSLIDAKKFLDSMVKNYHENGVTMYSVYGDKDQLRPEMEEERFKTA
ncbi:MAG TPA: AAC(3) family N-acetyltransferase [Bacteroidia bacterium]|nr:AAC(3) family N-acetyltransferase [Bacteroidia bacterium]